VADTVRKDQIVAAGVERATGIEECLRVGWAQQRTAVCSGPMENQDRIVDLALGVAVWFAERRIMDFEARQRFAVAELVVVKPSIRLCGGGIYLWSQGEAGSPAATPVCEFD
jgi:hypothetical protein